MEPPPRAVGDHASDQTRVAEELRGGRKARGVCAAVLSEEPAGVDNESSEDDFRGQGH